MMGDQEIDTLIQLPVINSSFFIDKDTSIASFQKLNNDLVHSIMVSVKECSIISLGLIALWYSSFSVNENHTGFLAFFNTSCTLP
jgi:hypothetical protein